MARCDVCGNDYRRTMEIRCRVIGHGVEHGDRIFCCAHCAEKSGVRATEVNA